MIWFYLNFCIKFGLNLHSINMSMNLTCFGQEGRTFGICNTSPVFIWVWWLHLLISFWFVFLSSLTKQMRSKINYISTFHISKYSGLTQARRCNFTTLVVTEITAKDAGKYCLLGSHRLFFTVHYGMCWVNSIGYNDPHQHSNSHMKWSSPCALSGVFQSDTVHLTCYISGVTDQLVTVNI